MITTYSLQTNMASGTTPLLWFTDNVLKSMDDSEITVATFLNLAKAFNIVNRKILPSCPLLVLIRMPVNGSNRFYLVGRKSL